MKKVAFISGHILITKEEFEEHYIPLIDKAIADGCDFVVGDAPGVDFRAQQYLKENCDPQRVTVYHMDKLPRKNVGFQVNSDYKDDEERDADMTRNSDFDIAWVRPGKEKSGTAWNIKRRAQYYGEPTIEYIDPEYGY